MSTTDVYNRFDSTKQYDSHLFRASKGLQSAEMNEIQQAIHHRLQGLGDVLFNDGDVVLGTEPILSVDQLSLFDSVLYIRGAMRQVPAATLTVATTGEVVVGVYLVSEVITAIDDPALRDPAQGTRNYQEEGANRIKITLSWGYATDGQVGDFFPVYGINDGNLLQNSPPPQVDATLQLVARYDQNANGHYVVEGMETSFIEEANGNQVFSVSEGACHVSGFEVRNVNSSRLIAPLAPDTDTIVGEPHTFTDSGDGTAVIVMNKDPIASVSEVRVTKRTATSVTHGGFTGATDALPDESVLAIVSVVQGGTTYVIGDDFLFTGDELDWSPAGAEPAPSSSYTVTYDHIVTIEPLEVTNNTVKIDTALNGTVAYFTYTWKLPRIDRIVVNQNGVISLVRGTASKYNPRPAAIPTTVLGLASVTQLWNGSPTITNDGVKVIPMNQLENMKKDIADLFDLVASERLRNNANSSEPTAKKGVFVDPFLDDDLRDQGIAQTASIVAGELMLSMNADIADVSANMGDTETLDYTYEAILTQNKSTGSMKINPYQAFDPVPAKVRLNRAVDRFTVVNTVWGSPITRRIWVWSSSFSSGTVLGVSNSVSSSSSVVGQAEFLRPISINLTASGFGANEVVDTITFDGVDVTPV